MNGGAVSGEITNISGRVQREPLGMSDHHIVGLMRWRHAVHKGVVKTFLCDGSLAVTCQHVSRGQIEVTHKDKVS